MSMHGASKNFNFLAEHDPLFVELASAAERAFTSDPNTTLIKLRQLGEALAQHIAALAGVEFDDKTSQADLLYKINRELNLEPVVRELFHTLRIEGNKATHKFRTKHKEAISGLIVARKTAIWFHQAFGKSKAAFKPGPFIPPADPSKQLSDLQSEIAKLKNELDQANMDLNSNQQLTSLIAKEKDEYEALAHAMDEESRALAKQAKAHEAELERQQTQYEAKIKELQAQLSEQDDKTQTLNRQQLSQDTLAATQNIVLDEALTRILIDQQLIEAGWEADSEELTYKKGARPEKGRYIAIAEWPCTGKQRADYVLFSGLTPIAVVEAKKENINVSGKILQAERYSKNIQVTSPLIPAWELAGITIAWPDENDGHYKVPFVYSCNGRPYIPQLAEQSGTWFRDVRSPANTKRALSKFHTPHGLLDYLNRSKADAQDKLKAEPFGYLKLRDYQEKAILAVESTLAKEIRTALLAMATGTGKTRTIIGLMYRFLKTERFKRILFLVDRSALGQQAIDAFNEAPLEQNHTLSKIYNVAELGDMVAEAETRVQVATVQAMVQRVFRNDSPPPVDQFDCIIIDEAHRGYTLDQEMTDGELATRDASQYISSYRRVLDYFDAIKIGLTATPAKHTSDIFGKPVYTYSYREAVADDWLIDHEPPIRYETLLTQNGINFTKGETIHAINTQTGEVQSAELEDELSFDVASFNRSVINENFNRVICEQLVNELDPFGDEKTIIFCAPSRNGLHADIVKRLLDEQFKKMYGSEYNQAAVEIITGASDKVDQLIRRFKNERYPNIAITVDLLTTGIDIPSVSNLVFFRRVKSRILYEQMIGRATRRCDEIGKTVFRIYDPVDIYAALSDVNTMKPLVKDPNITIEQLVDEITNTEHLERALNAPGEQQDQSHADVVLSQLSQKVMRILRKADSKADSNPTLKKKLDELHTLWEIEPKTLHKHLQEIGPRQASMFFNKHSGLLNQLAQVKAILGSERHPVISEHYDEIRERTQSYGAYSKPEDYIDSFNEFIKDNLNKNAALGVVINRPRDLTREQLKEIKQLLDGAGYTEANLQSAVRNQTNQDIAASIIGHIRRAALGEPLIPFEQRIAQAMQRIYQSHNWLPAQRKWLERLAKQLVHEVIIDRDFVNARFGEQGGAKQLDKVLGNQLDSVLEELSEAIWPPKKSA